MIEKKIRIAEAILNTLEAIKQEELLINCVKGSMKGYAQFVPRAVEQMKKDLSFHRENVSELTIIYRGQVNDLYNLNQTK